jgi:hypothetical protein
MRGAGEFLHDRQKRTGRQQGRLVRQGVNNGGFVGCHRVVLLVFIWRDFALQYSILREAHALWLTAETF